MTSVGPSPYGTGPPQPPPQHPIFTAVSGLGSPERGSTGVAGSDTPTTTYTPSPGPPPGRLSPGPGTPSPKHKEEEGASQPAAAQSPVLMASVVPLSSTHRGRVPPLRDRPIRQGPR